MNFRSTWGAVGLAILCGSLILGTVDCSFSIGPDGGSFSFNSGGGQTGNNNPAATVDVSRSSGDPRFDDGTTGVTAVCGVQANTTISAWNLVFTDGTSRPNTVLYYPFSHTPTTGYIQVATRDLHNANQHIAQINADAISEWSSVLQARVQQDGTYGAAPQEDVNDSTAPYISETWSTNYSPHNPNDLADTALGVSADGSHLNATYITYYGPAVQGRSDDSVYAAALHELGHAQGLNHNHDIGSAMFPFNEDANDRDPSWTTCIYYNGGGGAQSAPPTQDTVALEQHYDPIIMVKKMCGQCPCLQGTARSVQSVRSAQSGCPLSRIAAVSPTQQTAPARTITFKPTPAQTRQFWNSLNWYQVEDSLGGRTISSETLYAATPVVVRGRVGATVTSVPNGSGDLNPVHAIRLENVYRDEENGAGIAPGTTIYVSDNVMPFGKQYENDPVLKPGEDVVLYLRRPEGRLFAGVPQRVYVTTVPYGGKWRIDAQGRYKVPAGTRVAVEANGRSAVRAVNWNARTAVDGRTRARAILGRRGISPAQADALQQQLRTNPLGVLRTLSRADARAPLPSAGGNPLL